MGKRPQYKWRSVVITGGSSGIGRALALELARPGVTLAITGRDGPRLAEAEAALKQRGAMVETALMDVTDREAMAAWLAALDRKAPIDLVIANAGVSSATLPSSLPSAAADPPANDLEALTQIFDINVMGVLNTLQPVLEPMRKRQAGQLVLMGSLAGYRGMPYAPGYSASKVAVHALAEALRGRLEPDGIGVSLIAPGFIRSRITDANQFWMPWFMEAEPAARLMLRRVSRNAALTSFPLPMMVGSRILGILPPWLYLWLQKFNPVEK